MIRMPVRHDHKRKLVPAIGSHLRDGVLDAAEVFRMHPAIDQNVPWAVAGWYAQEKEIAKADPIHPHPKSGRALARGSRCRDCAWRVIVARGRANLGNNSFGFFDDRPFRM